MPPYASPECWFDKDAFDRIESALVARMIAEALKSYNAQVKEVPKDSLTPSKA